MALPMMPRYIQQAMAAANMLTPEGRAQMAQLAASKGVAPPSLPLPTQAVPPVAAEQQPIVPVSSIEAPALSAAALPTPTAAVPPVAAPEMGNPPLPMEAPALRQDDPSAQLAAAAATPPGATPSLADSLAKAAGALRTPTAAGMQGGGPPAYFGNLGSRFSPGAEALIQQLIGGAAARPTQVPSLGMLMAGR